jgi:cell division protein FtsB
VKSADLSQRVRQFRTMGMPRQPKMHKGTLFLVEDLVLEIERLEEENDRLERENAALRDQLSRSGNTRP